MDRFLILLHLVDPDVDLAPDPALRTAMLARVPLALDLDLDPRAVDQQVQGAVRTAIGDVHLQGLLASRQRAEVGHGPVQADQPQQALDEPSSPWSLEPVAFPWLDLAERHAERTFIVRQAWIAASP